MIDIDTIVFNFLVYLFLFLFLFLFFLHCFSNDGKVRVRASFESALVRKEYHAERKGLDSPLYLFSVCSLTDPSLLDSIDEDDAISMFR